VDLRTYSRFVKECNFRQGNTDVHLTDEHEVVGYGLYLVLILSAQRTKEVLWVVYVHVIEKRLATTRT
jgi:hypothetical protein